MPTKIEIGNMALGNLGTAKQIQSFDERSEEARAIKQFFDVCFLACVRDFIWPFTKQFRTLQLVMANPTTEWLYAYRYPNDFVRFNRILSGIRNDTRQTRVPYIESSDSQGKLILTDQQEAQAEGGVLPQNISIFPADFAIAMSYRLSYYISPRLTGGNAFSGLKKDMWDAYLNELSRARSNAANETQPDPLPESEFIRARGYDNSDLDCSRRKF